MGAGGNPPGPKMKNSRRSGIEAEASGAAGHDGDLALEGEQGGEVIEDGVVDLGGHGCVCVRRGEGVGDRRRSSSSLFFYSPDMAGFKYLVIR